MKQRLIIVIGIVGTVIFVYFLRNRFTTEKLDLQNLQYPCRIERNCGDLVGIDCASAVDGPYYYVDKNSGKIIEYCGGLCMISHGKPRGKYCRNCPPKEWTCETY